MSNDPYSRVYWTVMDDEKFDGIREDVRLFGAWSLMLVVADMAWPAPAFVPPAVNRPTLARLVACGLIEDLPGKRFRVHGLAAEREKRSDSARNAAALRWQKNRNAESMPSRGLAEAEDRRDEESPQTPQSGDHGEVNPRANGTNPRANGTNPRAVAAREAARILDTSKARSWRVQQRDLAYYRGDLTEAERDRHNADDVPVDEIPGWAEHQASLNTEASPWDGGIVGAVP